MSIKSKLSAEMRNAVIWLERQPGVTSVVQGQKTGSRHHHKPGWTRVSQSDEKSVHLRTYDRNSMTNLFVYAPAGAQRDRWVAMLSSGEVINANGDGPKVAPAVSVVKTVVPKPGEAVPRPDQTASENVARVYSVTPEMAIKWLERNTRNRPLRDTVVQRYAADMRAGRWMVTNDAIAFDTLGAVIEGQHRLWAVIEADVTVDMLVIFDLDPEAVNVVGDAQRRTLTDVAHIVRPGSPVLMKHTSISRAMQFASIAASSAEPSRAMNRLTRNQQLDFLDRHFAAIEFSMREVFKSASQRGLTTASLLATVARAYYTQDKERLRQFGAVVLTGVVKDPQDDGAAVLLRNWLLRMEKNAARQQAEVVYRKSARALLSFLKREHIKTLYEATEELFKLPEDMPAAKAKAMK